MVPLLGMQYILTPFKPKPGHPWEIVYEIVSAFTTSFQVSRLWNEVEERGRERKREEEGGRGKKRKEEVRRGKKREEEHSSEEEKA